MRHARISRSLGHTYVPASELPTRIRKKSHQGARWIIENSGGPVATRTPDLYRVNVAQALENQQKWPQVVDSAFDRMGQIGPILRSMGHKGPKFSGKASTLISELGKCIRQMRQRLGQSVETLASTSGLPGEYIEAVEAGRVELSVRALAVICEALGLYGTILFRKNGDQEIEP